MYVLFFHACSKDTIWEFSLVITNTPHRHNYTLYAAWRNHLWSASITKSSRGPPCKMTKCFTRRKETKRVDVHRYKDLDSSSNDLSLFPSIIVLCLKSLITSSITGTEHNNAQTRITPWTVLTFPHPVAMFDLVIQITEAKQNGKKKKKRYHCKTDLYIYIFFMAYSEFHFSKLTAILLSKCSFSK